MITEHDTALEQQGIVHLLADIKSMGPLRRRTGEGEVAVSMGKQVWTELPGLQEAVTTMLRGLAERTYRESSDPVRHWRNLNALAARLSACGIAELRICALWCVRYTLEEPDEALVSNELATLDSWLGLHSYWLQALALFASLGEGYIEKHRKPSAIAPTLVAVPPGPLALEAGLSSDDVTLERWQFWRKRLSAYIDSVGKTEMHLDKA
jgi:hypothetical protein